MRNLQAKVLICSLLLTLQWPPAIAVADAEQPPFADIHVHFNWDQKEIISAAEVVQKLRRANIAFAVVASTPSRLALELKQAGGDLILPIFSPYTHHLGRNDWYRREDTLVQARAGLESGAYRGIGEVHFMGGFRPRADNRVFAGLLELAREYDVPVLIHVDAGSDDIFIGICSANPDLRLLFAHAGGNLYPAHIRRIVETCANVMVEFSARDPWRYGGLTGDDGLLLPEWRELVLAYPDRFVTGTDPVWKVTRTQTWDQADDGWDHFEKLLDYHRSWIDDLPPAVGRKIRLDNALRFFDRPR